MKQKCVTSSSIRPPSLPTRNTMKILVALVPSLVAGILLAGVLCSCTPKSRIEGSVFIVEKDAPSVKLALVSIAAIPEKDFDKTKLLLSDTKVYESVKTSYVKFRKDVDEVAQAAVTGLLDLRAGDSESAKSHNKASSERLKSTLAHHNRETARLIKNLMEDVILPCFPPAIASTKTDADGKFALRLPAGKYVLVASSNRDTGEYFWLSPLDTENVPSPLMLSNDLLLNNFDKVWAFLSRFGLSKPNIQE